MTQHTPRNTTRAICTDPAEALLMLAGGPHAIPALEATGQQELLNSTVIPTDLSGATDNDLTALGFTLGPPVDGDPLFRAAALPDGWNREASDHHLWSHIVDQLSRRRCAIFYKGSFHDRRATMYMVSVSGYVRDCLHEGRTPVLDDGWATREAVLAAIAEAEEQAADRVTRYRAVGMDTAEEEKQAAACAALRTQLDEEAPCGETTEVDTTGIAGTLLHIEKTTNDWGATSWTWACPVCTGVVSAHTSDKAKALEWIAKYAPHTSCQPAALNRKGSAR